MKISLGQICDWSGIKRRLMDGTRVWIVYAYQLILGLGQREFEVQTHDRRLILPAHFIAFWNLWNHSSLHHGQNRKM
ncbi:hypothetical protein PGT21_029795 [Puccinia graminis f. sp. tritici]|uniref:Uncharacterized protein n=1 Tax=Puccinia graminis f. sp. tritici TaxID=56615 RepID=A0A5B0Q7B6_PUCGR|nr:hypothetical protein PGT21_029795 [Puccinia graminis f. sp. tritici]